MARVLKRLLERELRVAGPWLKAYLSEKPISDSFDPDHMYIEKVTLNKQDILRCFENESSKGLSRAHLQ